MAFILIMPLVANAAQVTNASLTLGDPRPSQVTSYAFTGSGFSGGSIQCIELKLATSANGTGTIAGLDTSSSSLGAGMSGWTVASVPGSLRATRTASALSGTQTFTWNNVTNGSSADTTYYGLFTAYSNVNCSTGPVDSAIVAFIYKNGALVTLDVQPTLTFTINSVASGQTVNGATTNTASTASAINFGTSVTSSTKGVSAHSLVASTNADNGFSVYLRQTGGFSSASHTISPSSGSNSSSSSFPAAGTEAWGYTTEDSSLGPTGAATRFTSPANGWAGMPTVDQLVMDSTTTGTQTTKVGHQLGISATTPAGSYNTTLVYTAAASY